MKALTIMQKILGEDNPKTATYYSNVGSTYIYKGNYKEAVRYLNKAKSILANAFGAEDQRVIDIQDLIDSIMEKDKKEE